MSLEQASSSSPPDTSGIRNPLWSQGPLVSALAALTLLVIVLPLTFAKPGLPPNLKADEAAYYGMAQSLGHDFDLRFDERDSQRFFDDYPYRFVRNVVLMSDDGWQTVHYGKPLVYSLVAAPFARLFGANGMLFLNAVLFVLAVWMGILFLARRMPPAQAALFSVGFFFLSAAFRYVFWLQPEIFSLFCVTCALFLGFDRRFLTNRTAFALLFLSGGALAAATYNKPMYAAIALPLVLPPLLEGYKKRAVFWVLGFLFAMACLCGIGLLLTGKASPYLGVKQRQGTTVCSPDSMPPEVEALRAAAEQERTVAVAAAATAASGVGSVESATMSPTGNSFSWLFRIPDVGFVEFLQSTGYFLWGRHAGLFVYFPFSLLAVVSFLLFSRGSMRRWLLLGSLSIIAVYFLVWINWNWQGGGGFIGNRYFVSLVPGFLFLVERLRMRHILVTTLLAGLFVGTLVLTPLGAGVPEPTMQAHTRNVPLRWLPLELSLRNVPGYNHASLGGLRVRGRSDQVLAFGDRLWLHGGTTNELHMLSNAPLDNGLTLLVSSDASPNLIEVKMRGAKEQLVVSEPGQAAIFRLFPKPIKKLRQYGQERWVYRLEATVDRGQVVIWEKLWQRPRCDQFAFNEKTNENFYLGAQLMVLGESDVLDLDVFSLDWQAARVPETVLAGQSIEVPVTVRNTSSATWPTLASESGSARVKLAYHWVEAGTQEVSEDLATLDRNKAAVWEGLRTELDSLMPAGGVATTTLEVEAPTLPGDYTLVLDALFEHVGWFSERDGREGNTLGRRVVVLK